MGDYCEGKVLDGVFVQFNGFIRDSKGLMIGRLVDSVKFEDVEASPLKVSEDLESQLSGLKAENEALKQGWNDTGKVLPTYGEPVVLSISGVVQHITYMLDGHDDTPDWFEPYHFESEVSDKFLWNKADYWIYVDDLPTPPSEGE